MSVLVLTHPTLRARRFVFPASLAGFFACLIGGISMLWPALDPDLGWHLRTGQMILATHSIPRTDPYSFTMNGAPWIEHEWLWQVSLAFVNSIGGALGVVVANALVVAVTLGLVYQRLRVRGIPTLYAATGTACAMVVLRVASEVRPAMVIPVMSALFLLAFELYEQDKRARWLAAVVPLEVIWANCHGSYVIGFMLCGVYGAAAFWSSRHWRSVVPWASLLAGLVAASFLNPLGVGLLRFTLFASRLPFNRAYIEEWKAPDFREWSCAPLLIAIVVTIVLGLLCKRWPRSKSQVLLLAGCTLAALQSRQFMVLYAVAAVPVIAEMLHWVVRKPARQELSALSVAAMGTTAIVLFALIPMRQLQPIAYEQKIAEAYPVEAVDYMEQQGLQGPMWDEFDWGGYLIGALPRLPVFVDGRTEMYGNSFLRQYVKVALAQEPADPILNQYGINLALIGTRTPLAVELRQDPAWRETYADDIASVFIRT